MNGQTKISSLFETLQNFQCTSLKSFEYLMISLLMGTNCLRNQRLILNNLCEMVLVCHIFNSELYMKGIIDCQDIVR